jgi:predicted methyltransferase MtxX (methanogen marker protein 4)
LKVIKKIRQFFSISLLFRTLFAPWKRDEINMGNLSLQDRLRVLVMNLISRLVGAIVRGGTIVVGIISIISTTIGFTFAISAFVLLPILSLLLLMTAFSGGIS